MRTFDEMKKEYEELREFLDFCWDAHSIAENDYKYYKAIYDDEEQRGIHSVLDERIKIHKTEMDLWYQRTRLPQCDIEYLVRDIMEQYPLRFAMEIDGLTEEQYYKQKEIFDRRDETYKEWLKTHPANWDSQEWRDEWKAFYEPYDKELEELLKRKEN